MSCDNEISSLFGNIVSKNSSTSVISKVSSSSKDKSSVISVKNIEDFQDLLIHTRDEVRKGNILIEVTYYSQFGPFIETRGTSTGSGVIYKNVDNTYYAISNHHVFTNIRNYKYKIDVMTMDGSKAVGTLLSYDDEKDIAVLSFDLVNNTDVTIIDIEERLNKPLESNEFLMAIGNPSGVEGNVTFGQFKGMARISNVDYLVIEHSALIYSGNSGGALIDIYGNLVGINTWGSEEAHDVSFAIPLSVINEFLIESGYK